MSYTIFFAIAAGSPRTAGIVLAALAVVVIAAWGSGNFDGVFIPIMERINDWRAPLGIFGGRWMLIDV